MYHFSPTQLAFLFALLSELNNMELTTLVSETFRRVEISQDL